MRRTIPAIAAVFALLAAAVAGHTHAQQAPIDQSDPACLGRLCAQIDQYADTAALVVRGPAAATCSARVIDDGTGKSVALAPAGRLNWRWSLAGAGGWGRHVTGIVACTHPTAQVVVHFWLDDAPPDMGEGVAYAPPTPIDVMGQYGGSGGASGLSVTVSVAPNPMHYGDAASLTATTTAGAVCVPDVIYSTGDHAVSLDRSPVTIPASGTYTWPWHEETIGTGGTASARCTFGAEIGQGFTNFTVVQ